MLHIGFIRPLKTRSAGFGFDHTHRHQGLRSLSPTHSLRWLRRRYAQSACSANEYAYTKRSLVHEVEAVIEAILAHRMGDNDRCTVEGFMLRDRTIQNYRSFKEFQIDALARVNLIVGMNNSGKTSLLEAVYLLVNQNEPSRLLDLLDRRGEVAEQFFSDGATIIARMPT